jgi:hypothetical protein
MGTQLYTQIYSIVHTYLGTYTYSFNGSNNAGRGGIGLACVYTVNTPGDERDMWGGGGGGGGNKGCLGQLFTPHTCVFIT